MDDEQRQEPSTADLVAWDRAFVWHPFTPMKPWCENKEIVVIARGEREFLIDTQGRRYIDGVSSLWCNVHGHCVPELDAAVRRQLGHIAHSTLLGLANVPSVMLAKRLVELANASGLGGQGGLRKVFFSDDGSTAVEVACKMAYQFWRNVGEVTLRDSERRARFMAFEQAYHGDTMGAVSLGGISLFHQTFKGLCFPVDFVPAPEGNGANTLAAMAELLRRNPGAYAGIVVEPLVLGAGGMVMYAADILRKMQTLARRHNVLLIADEVLTGFGRTGSMFACEQANVGVGEGDERFVPEFLCLSKGLTGGYLPLGATMTTGRIFDGFYVNPNEPGAIGKTFFHGHTFTGNPLACAVALASIELFEKNKLLEHVGKLMTILAKAFQGIEGVAGRAFVRGRRQCGLIGAIDLAFENGGAFPQTWRVAAELCTRLRGRGVMLRPLAETLVVMPPLAISEENMAVLCNEVVGSLRWVDEIVKGKLQGG